MEAPETNHNQMMNTPKMISCGRESRQIMARFAGVGLAMGLLAVAPSALAQKMYKCDDGKGGKIFQQSPCAETAQEAEAREKETARLKEAEAAKKAEEERKKAEAVQKAKERDKLYQQQMEERAREAAKAQEAESKLLQGTTQAKDVSDGTLTADMETMYPGPWRTATHPALKAALEKAKAKDCDKFRYRQRVGGGSGEFLVHCTKDGASWHTSYLVWLASGSVRGPFKL